MLDDSWQESLSPVLNGGAANEGGDHQYLMFSATFSKESRGKYTRASTLC